MCQNSHVLVRWQLDISGSRVASSETLLETKKRKAADGQRLFQLLSAQSGPQLFVVFDGLEGPSGIVVLVFDGLQLYRLFRDVVIDWIG